ncbi:hypothetical protein HK100_006525, partial [Physocladia obscura]
HQFEIRIKTMTELTADCCALKASFNSEYTPTGHDVQVISTDDYYAAPPSGVTSTKAVVWVYDIFGMHANTRQAADLLAKQLGVHVIAPNFFRDEKCDRAGGRAALMAFVGKHSYAAHVRDDVRAVLAWLAADKHVTSVAVFGLCWGGRIAVNAGQESGEDWALVKAVGSAHPSLLTADDGKTLAVPLCLLPSSGEDTAIMDAIFHDVKANTNIAEKSVHVRFNDMPHGFVGAGADFNDPAKLKAANDALNLAADFFKANL